MNIQPWQIASGLGAGAFVAFLFYLVVKHFGQSAGKGFQTSRLGPEATAIIAVLIIILFGAITIIALVLYAPKLPPPDPVAPPVHPQKKIEENKIEKVPQSSSRKNCYVISETMETPIPLTEGTCFTNAKRTRVSEVTRLAESGIIYTNYEGKNITCSMGDTCSFGWEESPLFHVLRGTSSEHFLLIVEAH